ncbi:M20/M25/M40 family metallo-hydrolase [Luteimonas sp. SJ-92]|uniref:M20/M25/M40 family metallo-hydrolase n=1 Tax=Luteimonas salinisoli TaxID=2752307 RepID=A0A853JGE8_9GAMM|nr:M20/M25/M40 family metallo-hydrolase [Luteimonas salinisoli]NZA28493.1 M20/M25/M40 family metallo-hydrolase [Luteimonas salinisoli]
MMEARSSEPTLTASLVVLAVLAACATWWSGLSPSLQPPAAVAATAPSTEFSAERARAHLRIIAESPRPLGSAAHARTRGHVVEALRGLGLDPQLQQATVVRGTERTVNAAAVSNIVARIPGTGSGQAVVLAAHYDSVPHSPGANDAGNGVAAILETVRALQAGPALRNDVIVLITDAEEPGLVGARAYVDEHPWARETGIVLNAEGRGNAGPVYMFRTVGANGGMVGTLARSVPGALADSVSNELFKVMPNDTDLSVFRDAGYLGMDFANVRGFTHYHTALDNYEQADPRTLQHHGEYLLALTRAFGRMDLSRLAAPERVYFALPLVGIAHYPVAWALPLSLAALALAAWLAVHLYRGGHWRPRGAAIGLLHFIAALIGLPVLAVAAWALVGRWVPELAWFHHGAPYDGHRYLLALALPAIAVYLASLAWLRRRAQPTEMVLGPALVWLLLALATAAWMPGAGYVFLWPLLFALAGLAVVRLHAVRRPAVAAIALVLGALPVVYFMTPMVVGMEEAMTLDAVALPFVLLALTLGLLAPQLDFVARPTGRIVPGLLLAAGVGVLAAALLATGFHRDRRQADTLEYVADATRGEAFWASLDPEPNAWTRQYLGDAPQRTEVPDWASELFARDSDPLIRPAVATHLDAPGAELMDEIVEGETRRLRLRIASPPNAYATVIEFPEGVPVTGLRIDGRPAPADIASDGVRVTWFAPPAQGAVLEFVAPTAARLELLLRSNIPGVPPPDGAEAIARPQHTMAAGPWTERTRLQRTVSF